MPKIEVAIKEAIDRGARRHVRRVATPMRREVRRLRQLVAGFRNDLAASRPRPRSGKTEVGTVVAFISGLSRMNDPWGALVDYFRDLTNVGVKYRMIAAALDKPLAEPA